MKQVLTIFIICLGLIGNSQIRVKAAKPSQRIFFDGNSLTNLSEGNLDNGFRVAIQTQSLITGTKPIFNSYGIRGRRITQLTSEFTTKIGQYSKPGDIVVMWEMCNSAHDHIGDVNGDTIYAETVAYCALARSYGMKVIIVTGIARDVTSGGLDDANISARIFAANTQIRNNWASFCDGIADPAVLSMFDEKADVANATYYHSDRVHLTNAGYDIIAGLVQPIIQPFIITF